MPVETLGEALSYGWRITARCAAASRGYEAASRMPLSGRIEHGNTCLDAKQRVPAVTSGNPIALPEVRIA